MISPLMQFDLIAIIYIKYCINEIIITNVIIITCIVIILSMFLLVGGNIELFIPRGWQIILERVFMFILRIVEKQLGEKGLIYFPFILTLFFFILLLNLYGLLPFSYAVTGYIGLTLFFSSSICFGIFLIGIQNNGVKFLKLFIPEVPMILYPMMILIEIGSYIIRSFSLGIRLSANIIAGHTLVHIIGELVAGLSQLGSLLLILPFIVLVLIMILEIGVACLQAYIFIVLVTLYLNDSINFHSH